MKLRYLLSGATKTINSTVILGYHRNYQVIYLLDFKYYTDNDYSS